MRKASQIFLEKIYPIERFASFHGRLERRNAWRSRRTPSEARWVTTASKCSRAVTARLADRLIAQLEMRAHWRGGNPKTAALTQKVVTALQRVT